MTERVRMGIVWLRTPGTVKAQGLVCGKWAAWRERASAIGADSTTMFRDAAVSFSRANAEVLVRT